MWRAQICANFKWQGVRKLQDKLRAMWSAQWKIQASAWLDNIIAAILEDKKRRKRKCWLMDGPPSNQYKYKERDSRLTEQFINEINDDDIMTKIIQEL